jgi:hypothetical protein
MARHQRINLSLPPDVVDTLDEKDNMSAFVADAVREYDG